MRRKRAIPVPCHVVPAPAVPGLRSHMLHMLNRGRDPPLRLQRTAASTAPLLQLTTLVFALQPDVMPKFDPSVRHGPLQASPQSL